MAYMYNNTTNEVLISPLTKSFVQRIIEVCIFTVIGVFIFCGNLLVCVAIYKNANLRTVTNIHIFSLALTDLFQSIIGVPFVIHESATGQVLNISKCEIRSFSTLYLASVSLHTMTLISLNRYVTIVKPALHPRIYKKKTTVMICISTWLIALVVLIIGYEFIGLKFLNKRYTMDNQLVHVIPCVFDSSATGPVVFAIVVFIFYALFALVTITLCYTRIYRKLKQHNNTVAPSLQGRNHGNTQGICSSVEEVKITRTLSAVLVGFFVCWLPPIVVSISYALTSKDHKTVFWWRYENFYYVMPVYISSLINPFIYCVTSKAFRKAFHEIICHFSS